MKEKYSVGLDIGTSALKLVKLKLGQETAELCAFACQEVAPELNLAEQIKKLIEPQGIKVANVSLSGPSAIVRYVNFPNMSAGELKNALKFEAQKHLPFAADEANLDACILKTGLSQNQMLVALAAARIDLVSARLKILQAAGLSANLLDIDSAALVNAFNFNYPQDESLKNKAVGLLNIGAQMSNLNIIEAGTPRLSRDIQIGGAQFSASIAEAFSLDLKAAEARKLKNPSAEDALKFKAAIEPVAANLAREIRTSCDYYESQNASNVGKIFLSGGSGSFAPVKEALAALLNLPLEPWDPLKQITLANGLDAEGAKRISGQLAVAVGLALRG
jgi:type IV pilus assembly protein PilM